jgi:pimeloyl-ACP methyl ester carboxylesterase
VVKIVRLAMVAAVIVAGCAAQRSLPPYDPVSMDPPAVDRSFPARLDEVSIDSGGASMNAIVYVAQGDGPHPTVILLHGFPGSERNLDLAQAIRRSGWNVVFFHYRGAWGSEGTFSFTHVLQDVAAVVEHVRSPEFSGKHRVDRDRLALVGHSMGGFAALVGGSEVEAVRCIASIAGANVGLMGRAAGADPEQLALMAGALDTWSGPIRGASGRSLIEEAVRRADRFDPLLRVDALAMKPVLLVAGERDRVTPLQVHHAPLVQALQQRGNAKIRAVTLDADHAFSDKRLALARSVVGWLNEECE